MIGYVAGVQNQLLSTTMEEKKAVMDEYEAKVPEPMSSAFTEKLTREAAIERQDERKRKVTTLFPNCKFHFLQNLQVLF